MTTQKIISACPRDCQDCCSLEVEVKKGKITSVGGDPDHPVTRGFVCPRGQAYPELIYHPDRILKPRLKSGEGWEEISWEKALDVIEEKIRKYSAGEGPAAIFHYHYSGSESLTKKITMRFFDRLGATGVKGDLCLAAGVAAQQYDFGGLEQNDLQDLLNSRGCVLWGRNCRVTQSHALPFIQKGKRQGMKLAIINPLPTGWEEQADLLIQPYPGTDAALALGVSSYLLEKDLIDRDFLEAHTLGFSDFKERALDFSLEKTSRITGVAKTDIIKLAHFMVDYKPVTTLLGYGLTRYRGGGNTIRAIDALTAITNNIGREGAGVSYCSDRFWFLGAHLQGGPSRSRRFLDMAYLGQEILEADNPPLKMGFIHAANPLLNAPDTKTIKKALEGLEFLVVSEMFMTDTARQADLLLPCTSFAEEEGVRVSSWSPWVYYCPQIIEPRGQARADEDVIIELARRLKVQDFPWNSREELLQWAAEPLAQLGISLEKLREKGHQLPPEHNPVAWARRKFRTPSGRIELYSSQAQAKGLDPVASYLPPQSAAGELPLHLITPHSYYRIHSQFQVAPSIQKLNPIPELKLHPDLAHTKNVEESQPVRIFNERGAITARARINKNIHPQVIQIESGWSLQSGAGVNQLIPPLTTDMGQCGALYDARVDIEPLCQVGDETSFKS